MFFLSDYNISEYGRKKGSSDKIPSWRRSLRRLRKSTFNPNTANAAAVGATLGLTGGAIAGSTPRANKIGAIGGLAAGTTAGIISSYRNKRNKY